MPSWNEIATEIQQTSQGPEVGPNPDIIRLKYIQALSSFTNRNVISYYSNFLKRSGYESASIVDDDKNAFMANIKDLDTSKGLDLILHTPGGGIAATESIVDYLHKMFDNNIRVIIPQIAMSAGTMIACASKEIIMGKQSSLGPIDPQMRGIPTHGVLEEYEQALNEIAKNPHSTPIWQTIFSQYHPSFIGECKKSMDWSEEIVNDWLRKCMFQGEPDATAKAIKVVTELSDHNNMKAHDRHIPIDKCKEIGLKVLDLESNDNLQDIVLSIHHSTMHTFSMFPRAMKIT